LRWVLLRKVLQLSVQKWSKYLQCPVACLFAPDLSSRPNTTQNRQTAEVTALVVGSLAVSWRPYLDAWILWNLKVFFDFFGGIFEAAYTIRVMQQPEQHNNMSLPGGLKLGTLQT
jgi:hypothetical protein